MPSFNFASNYRGATGPGPPVAFRPVLGTTGHDLTALIASLSHAQAGEACPGLSALIEAALSPDLKRAA